MHKRLKVLLPIICLFLSFSALGQNAVQDSTGFQFVDSTKVQSQIDGTNAAIDSLFIRTDTVVEKTIPKLGLLLSRIVSNSKNYSIEIGRLKLKLQDEPDFTTLDTRLPELKATGVQLANLILDKQDVANSRWLNGVANFMTYFEGEKDYFDNMITNRIEDLIDIGDRLDKIRQDSLIRLTLKDSTILPEINQELKRLQGEIDFVDSTLLNQEIQIATYQAKVADLSIQFLNLRQFFRQSEEIVKKRSWNKEVNYIWEPKNYEATEDFIEVFQESVTTNLFVLQRYLRINANYLLTCLAIVLAIYVYTTIVIRGVKKRKEFASQILERVGFVNKYLLFSCIIVVLPFCFTFIENPTIVFSSMLGLFFVLISTPIVKERFPKSIFRLWMIFLPVYLITPMFALTWSVNFDERYFDLIIALLGITMGSLLIRETFKTKFVGSSIIRILSYIVILISLFSIGLNVMGRVSLAKTYAISSLANIYRGVSLYLFVQIILKLIYLWLEASKKEANVLTSFFDFQEIQQRLEGLLSLFAVGLWFYSLTYYLGFFTPIFNAVEEFLFLPRTLGNLEYEFSTILLFILIIVASVFIANNVAYFARVFDQKSAGGRNRKLGSSVLIIRLILIMTGLFIAMAAAKIPFEQITIVLGALSVGIGFGLQTIINNLVSGIILAFERPIQIGDDIQIGTQIGTVQEVGIRASKIRAYDGSEIILPNGDLLSQSLINWTLSDKRRRIELLIGVGYGSDMKQVNEVLGEVLNRERIMQNPKPKILMQNFGESSVDFRLLFWVENMDIWLDLRSEVMNAIFAAFLENNIEIPFPQRDLYLKSFPNNIKNVAEAVEIKESITSPKEIKQAESQDMKDVQKDDLPAGGADESEGDDE